MPAEIKKEIQLEIAHVLFTDIVGYSKLLINEQRAQIVRSTEHLDCGICGQIDQDSDRRRNGVGVSW